MQKILTLIITGAIIYMIFQQNVNSITPPPHLKPQTESEKGQDDSQPDAELSGNFFEKTLSSVLINVLKTDEGRMFMESMLQPMNKSVAGSGGGFSMNSESFITSIFKISTFGDGEKGPASCGQIVTVEYKILSSSNIALEEKTTTFQLGSGKIAPGMDAVIVGMKTGQTRHATITNKYMPETVKDKISSFKIRVLLKKIMPENFIGDEVKVFDDQLAYRIPLICANKAIYDAKITRLRDSEVIYNSLDSGKKINMVIGNLNYPVIFSHALHNKIPVGTRTVIAPGRLFKSYASDYSTIFPKTKLPEDENFMIEFFNFDESILTERTTFKNGGTGK
jgi:hypothetical protein